MKPLYAWILSRYSASRSHGTNECPRCEPSLHQLGRTSAVKCTKSHSWLGNDTNPLCIPNPPNHTRTDKSNQCAQSDCPILVCGTESLHLSPLPLSSEPWGRPWQPQLESVRLSNSWFSEPYWLGSPDSPCLSDPRTGGCCADSCKHPERVWYFTVTYYLGITLQPYNSDPMTYIHNWGKEHHCQNSPADPRGQCL